MKIFLLVLLYISVSLAVFTGNCYITGLILSDKPNIGIFLDCLFFVVISLFFLRYHKQNSILAYAVFLPPVLIFSALLIKVYIEESGSILFHLNMLASVLLSIIILTLKGLDLKYRAIFGIVISAVVSFIIYPKLKTEAFYGESTIVKLSELTLEKVKLFEPDSTAVAINKEITPEKILVFSFVGCKPCKDLKNTLLKISANDSLLKKRLIFITNGQLSTFQQYLDHEQYAGIRNYYDSAGIMSDKYVPENQFPVTYILKNNATAIKYPGFNYSNKKIIYELIKKN